MTVTRFQVYFVVTGLTLTVEVLTYLSSVYGETYFPNCISFTVSSVITLGEVINVCYGFITTSLISMNIGGFVLGIFSFLASNCMRHAKFIFIFCTLCTSN